MLHHGAAEDISNQPSLLGRDWCEAWSCEADRCWYTPEAFSTGLGLLVRGASCSVLIPSLVLGMEVMSMKLHIPGPFLGQSVVQGRFGVSSAYLPINRYVNMRCRDAA